MISIIDSYSGELSQNRRRFIERAIAATAPAKKRTARKSPASGPTINQNIGKARDVLAAGRDINYAATAYDWACCFIQSVRNGKTVNGSEKILRRNVTLHDARGLPLQTTDTSGSITRYEYDIDGHLAKLTDARNQTSEWTHNAAGQLTGKKNAAAATETYSYDSSGRMAAITNRRGGQTQIAYDYDG